MEYLAEIMLSVIAVAKFVSGFLKSEKANSIIEKVEIIVSELIRVFKIEKD